MGKVKQPDKVKLIIGMISNDIKLFLKLEELLSKQYGYIDLKSSMMKFSHTDYYSKEMGKNLKRKFVSFKELIFPDNLADIKLTTNTVEQKFLKHSRERNINLDPGYITKSKLILATTKNYQHRVYIKGGIYAEVTLRFKNNSFKKWEWTYPDYKTEEYINFFNEVREKYMKQMK